MAQLYVYICDRCKKREETHILGTPSYWVEIDYYIQNPYQNHDKEKQHLLFCQVCWARAQKLDPEPILIDNPVRVIGEDPAAISDEDVPF